MVGAGKPITIPAGTISRKPLNGSVGNGSLESRAVSPEDNTRKAEELFEQGRAFIKSKNYLEAVPCFRRAMNIRTDVKYYEYLGFALFSASRLSEAEKVLVEASTKYPKDAQIVRNLGRVYEVGGKLGEAVSTYEKSLELNPQDEDLRTHIKRIKPE